ncbi:hypothetical protein ON010_g11998 [Phytophthora cinnamomi]|nr:hypothetical protein ON010_g11998 [Phytophthora cinnamomi]
MHVKNILYVDVKPENFMLDTDKESKVYCVDFGISDRYVTATGKHKDYKEGTVVGTPTFLSMNCHSGATSSRRDDIESLLYVLIYLMRGDLPWQQASSDAEGAKIKKNTSVDQLCASLPREWSAMLKNIRECGFEDRPDYDFFAQQFSKLGGEKGLTTPFDWGSRKTSKAIADYVPLFGVKVAKVVVSQESTSDSPVRKRVKSVDEGLTAPPPGSAKAKKAAVPEKKKTTPRHSKAPTKKAAAPAHNSKPRASKASKKEKEAHDDVEVEFVGSVDPQDREVFKAIAGHAAATAAIKRHGDLENAETHKEMLRALSCVGGDRQSAETLQRLHAAEFALLRGQEKRAQVSERRSQLRGKWKQRAAQEGATLEDVQRRFPKLFEGVLEERTEPKKAVHAPVPPQRQAVVHSVAPPVPVAAFQPAASPPVVPTRVEPNAAARHDFNFTDDVWSGPPQAAGFSMPKQPPPQPVQQSTPALSDLLSKRSRLPHEDPELFGADTRPNPVQQRNPFQTASERLQHDRMTGRARNLDDDEPRNRNGRGRNPRGPPRGVYHPVNQDLLLGGGGHSDNEGYISGSSAVSKKFVSPVNDGGASKRKQQAPPPAEDENIDPRLKSCDPELIEKIEMEIVDNGDPITFDDIGKASTSRSNDEHELKGVRADCSSEENEASRRMKTEFLVQLDGAGTKAKDIILVVGATNRPQELDEAARRRFVKRLYIPLPSFEARLDLVSRLLKDNKNDLTDENKAFIAESTKGYSGADVRALCTEAAMGPIRNCADIRTMDADNVRPINLDDFKEALRGVRSSVATKDLAFYKEWNAEFGSFAFESHEAS